MHLGLSGQQWVKMTDKQRTEHINSLLEHFKEHIDCWGNEGKLEGECVIDLAIYSDVVRHYYEDLCRMGENIVSHHNNQPAHPDEFKQTAIYAFWIRKLKPIKICAPIKEVEGDHSIWINEIIAISLVLTVLDTTYHCEMAMKITPDLYHDLLYFFRYKSVSPHALYLILASLYFEHIEQ